MCHMPFASTDSCNLWYQLMLVTGLARFERPLGWGQALIILHAVWSVKKGSAFEPWWAVALLVAIFYLHLSFGLCRAPGSDGE